MAVWGVCAYIWQCGLCAPIMWKCGSSWHYDLASLCGVWYSPITFHNQLWTFLRGNSGDDVDVFSVHVQHVHDMWWAMREAHTSSSRREWSLVLGVEPGVLVLGVEPGVLVLGVEPGVLVLGVEPGVLYREWSQVS